jgi:secondary thiamine-phosphate synthase enzyme
LCVEATNAFTELFLTVQSFKMIATLNIKTHGQGLKEITSEVERALKESGIEQGLCTVFIQHTSASLIIQENADPSARADLERWLNKLVPERDPAFTHTAEGPDDMPSHIKAALTATSIGIPVYDGNLTLGTWQGIYVWEHRRSAHNRSVVVYVSGE